MDARSSVFWSNSREIFFAISSRDWRGSSLEYLSADLRLFDLLQGLSSSASWLESLLDSNRLPNFSSSAPSAHPSSEPASSISISFSDPEALSSSRTWLRGTPSSAPSASSATASKGTTTLGYRALSRRPKEMLENWGRIKLNGKWLLLDLAASFGLACRLGRWILWYPVDVGH